MARAKASELRGKSKDELTKQLNEFKQELNNLRVAKVILVIVDDSYYYNCRSLDPEPRPSSVASRKSENRSVAP